MSELDVKRLRRQTRHIGGGDRRDEDRAFVSVGELRTFLAAWERNQQMEECLRRLRDRIAEELEG